MKRSGFSTLCVLLVVSGASVIALAATGLFGEFIYWAVIAGVLLFLLAAMACATEQELKEAELINHRARCETCPWVTCKFWMQVEKMKHVEDPLDKWLREHPEEAN